MTVSGTSTGWARTAALVRRHWAENLACRVLRAAADGVLSTAKPLGGGKDDATLIYEAYTAMDSKHSEHTAGGAKANASKVRQIIGMGCMTTILDPVAVGDEGSAYPR